MSAQNSFDVLSGNAVQINQDYIITLTKQNSESIDQEAKEKCKILKFPSEWKFDEILSTISRLESQNYPNLFIFIIEEQSFGYFGLNSDQTSEKVEIVQKILLQSIKNRSIVLQLTSKSKNVSKFFCKVENTEEFSKLDQKAENLEDFHDFPSFFWLYLNRKLEDFEDLMLRKLPKVENSSLILRFLRTLKLSDDFFTKMVLKCAADGSKSDLLAAVDGYIDDSGEVRRYALFVDEICSTSVLFEAVQNQNQEVFQFLVKNCSKLIQQLPFDHQVEVSTAAFTTNQFKVLCDLLEICDFPFPRNLDPDSVTDEKLSKIINDRIKFHKDVLNENLAEIEAFAKNNPSLKFAYSLVNLSAFSKALNSCKFQSFFRLKTLGFEDREVTFSKDDINDDEERAKASKFARIQRRKNVESSIPGENEAVLLLVARSLIFRRDQSALIVNEQMKKILNWYAEIYKTKIGLKLFDAAAQCDELKIIFDFEYQTVEKVDVSASNSALGATYPKSKWIFIGAKLTGEDKREQEIKGVIAHEICHYVMRLVYQNKEHPYYGDDEEAARKFDEIVVEIIPRLFLPKTKEEEVKEEEELIKDEENESQIQSDAKVEANSEEGEDEEEYEILDDECDGTISSVFTAYNREDWQPELIVRPAHIQAQFDDDEEKIKQLEEKYKNLFVFWEKFVLPELEKFSMKKRENVRNFNKMTGILPEIQSSKIKLSKLHDLSELMDSQVTIVTSNVPKIFLINIYMELHKKCEGSIDFRNVFVTPECLENSFVATKFKEILTQKSNFSTFVDCTRGFETLDLVTACKKSKLIFIVSNEKQCGELHKNLGDINLISAKETMNYNWMDLTTESQNHLLQTKIDFQNNSTLLLSELISKGTDQQQEGLEPASTSTVNLEEIIDDQLLNLLVDRMKISINSQSEVEIGENNFRVLFRSRNLMKNIEMEPNEKSIHQPDEAVSETQERSLLKKFFYFPIRSSKIITNQSTEISKISDLSQGEQIDTEIVKPKKMSQEQK